MINSTNCITLKQLREFISKFPDQDAEGESFEVWIDNGDGTSSPCKELIRLNKYDIILGKNNGK